MKKFVLIIALILLSMILVGQVYDDVYYKPGDTIDTVSITNNYYYDFNNDGITYDTRICMFHYPFYYYTIWYYDYWCYPNTYDPFYCYPYYFSWTYYPYYWYQPYYNEWYGNIHQYNHNNNHKYYGPRTPINGNSDVPDIKTERPATRKIYTETYAKPKAYIPPSNTVTRSSREYKSPSYDDRTPKYWNDFNSVNKPVYRERDYNTTTNRTYNTQSKTSYGQQKTAIPVQRNTSTQTRSINGGKR
jgi:hypothetical protein